LIRAFSSPPLTFTRLFPHLNASFPSTVNAGTLHPLSPVSGLTASCGNLDKTRELFEVNFFSLISILSHAITYLKSRDGKDLKEGEPAGRVVLVSSGAATGGTGGWAAVRLLPLPSYLYFPSRSLRRTDIVLLPQYNASKAALNSLGRFVLLPFPLFPLSLPDFFSPFRPHFCSTLANEEKDIVTVSIRPGTPDTDMQTKIRELGPSHPLPFPRPFSHKLLPPLSY
jgi:NAD(P)-dependent dehydrogenase (short-subunit alcohol dehydrogenase family)